MVYSGMTASIITFITAVVVSTITCSPRSGQSWEKMTYLPRMLKCLSQASSLDVATCTVGVMLDFYLLYLPLPVLWNLQLQRKKKIRVIAIFMTGSM